jgi:hypothetical protein
MGKLHCSLKHQFSHQNEEDWQARVEVPVPVQAVRRLSLILRRRNPTLVAVLELGQRAAQLVRVNTALRDYALEAHAIGGLQQLEAVSRS